MKETENKIDAVPGALPETKGSMPLHGAGIRPKWCGPKYVLERRMPFEPVWTG